jgi:DNA-directed RNA polymerase subunit RPC12/RpoP
MKPSEAIKHLGSYDRNDFAAGLNRRAERTGRWIDEGDGYWKCSACSDEMVADAYGDIHPIADCGWIYCPNCGAKMDGEKEGV